MNGAMKKRSIPELVVLATGSAQNLEDHELFYIIENGIRLTASPRTQCEATTDKTGRIVQEAFGPFS